MSQLKNSKKTTELSMSNEFSVSKPKPQKKAKTVQKTPSMSSAKSPIEDSDYRHKVTDSISQSLILSYSV
ncbi:MAG TPA: hypothetical protein ENI07_23340 [Desulfobacterales bacterium]|nr:hypothetical protein [Desulfobacterales bacterium]